MYLWRKSVAVPAADPWIDRLSAIVDPQRIVVLAPAGKTRCHLEIYCDTEREAAGLTARFGGRSHELRDESWQPSPVTAPGKPLIIGRHLLVTSRAEELDRLRATHSDRNILCIPAAMAFGTGEHATTAMCLRLLLDCSRRRNHENWRILDLGTGSGILALAAKMFGASHVTGLDNDPHAVRIARENSQLNRFPRRMTAFSRADLMRWRPAQGETWPVVTANLFSELLIRLLPEVIAPCVAPGGDLILSGVLATQADEVVAAVRRTGLESIVTKARGRWRAFHCRHR